MKLYWATCALRIFLLSVSPPSSTSAKNFCAWHCSRTCGARPSHTRANRIPPRQRPRSAPSHHPSCSRMYLGRVLVVGRRDGDHADLARREPQRPREHHRTTAATVSRFLIRAHRPDLITNGRPVPFSGAVLGEDGNHALDRAEHGAVDHDGPDVGAVGSARPPARPQKHRRSGVRRAPAMRWGL